MTISTIYHPMYYLDGINVTFTRRNTHLTSLDLFPVHVDVASSAISCFAVIADLDSILSSNDTDFLANDCLDLFSVEGDFIIFLRSLMCL
jgi:hypothetical protein